MLHSMRLVAINVVLLLASTACDGLGITTPTPTTTATPATEVASPTPAPTPTPTPVPLAAAHILDLSREQVEKLKTLRVEMTGSFQQGDVKFPLNLKAVLELPDRAHGTFEYAGESREFLRLGEENYITGARGFEIDYSSESGAVLLELLNPLLETGAEQRPTDLARQPDETLGGQVFYRITFRMDMLGFLERLAATALPGVEIRGRGELLIDQESLLPHRFLVDCKGCVIPAGLDLVVDFTLSEFNQSVHIPTPTPATPTPVVIVTEMPVLSLQGAVVIEANVGLTAIDNVRFQVGVASQAAEGVDLSPTGVVISYIDTDQFVSLASTDWTATWLTGSGPLVDPGEAVEINVQLTGLSPLLGPSKEFAVQLNPNVGAVLVINLTTPPELTTKVEY